MTIPTLVLGLAALLVLVSLAEPLSQRLRLPASVVLAIIGILIGAAAIMAEQSGRADLLSGLSTDGGLPINSQVFLFIFLPALLFQAALDIDVRDLVGDAAPILSMAIVAVLIATLGIGLALWPLSGLPLIACFLVGAIVATTDPSAVIAIFRDLGAPRRLSRLVEGESLLNDAVAITLFVVLLEMLTGDARDGAATLALRLVAVPVGGGILGFLVARLIVVAFALSRDNRLVQCSLTVALPYLVFALAEHWHLSGPIAVAIAGLALSTLGPSRISPTSWRYLQEVWAQLAFWASSLVFVLAAILIPRLIGTIAWPEAAWVAALTAAALASRAAVLFLLLPVLTALKLSPAISRAYRVVMFWGGLRGAVTLALALAVTENAGVPAEVKRIVAVLATGFVLFTLLVQGTTLRPLMGRLGLDRLSPLDAALRHQALALARADVRGAIAATAERYALSPAAADSVAAEYQDRLALERPEGTQSSERIAVGLASLAAREHDLILQHLEDGTASQQLVGDLRPQARNLLDAARLDGEAGYRREALAALAFSRRIRLANALHSRFGISRMLERELGRRFELLLVQRIILNELTEFAERQIPALMGPAVGTACAAAIGMRQAEVDKALAALRLQYPDYADQLELRFLRRSTLRQEQRGYERLHDEGLVGQEVRRALVDDVAGRLAEDARPHLDLKLNTPALIRRVQLLADLEETDNAALASLMRPAFAIPGQKLVTKGERGDTAWFIASGAVEVETGAEQIRLGRGDVFGELALLTGLPRQADVTAIAYSHLLVLTAPDFKRFLDERPAVRSTIETIAADRLGPGHESRRHLRRAIV